eukprot:COSAG01_NODE_8648_length_2708_cov_44.219624_2_plen_212_part_00
MAEKGTKGKKRKRAEELAERTSPVRRNGRKKDVLELRQREVAELLQTSAGKGGMALLRETAGFQAAMSACAEDDRQAVRGQYKRELVRQKAAARAAALAAGTTPVKSKKDGLELRRREVAELLRTSAGKGGLKLLPIPPQNLLRPPAPPLHHAAPRGCRVSWRAHVHLSLCAAHSTPGPAPKRKACYRPSLPKDQRGTAAVGAPGWFRRPE